MTTITPFGPGGIYQDFLKRQREQQEILKNVLGPASELQQRMKVLQNPLANLASAQRIRAVETVTYLQGADGLGSIFRAAGAYSERRKALEAIGSPIWMLELQKTATALSRNADILKTQNLLAASTGPDLQKLSRSFAAQQSIMADIMVASRWAERFRHLSDGFGSNLLGIKIAAERARMLDMATLRASAEIVVKSAAVSAADSVLEAHRLIDAIGQSESPAESANLLAALLSLMAVLFTGFRENTVKELRGVGAVTLIGFVGAVISLLDFSPSPERTPAENASVADVGAGFENMQAKLAEIVAAGEKANEAYVAGLPRAELKRRQVIRREPHGNAAVLMRGEPGMLLAIKEIRGRWRLVVYRDPLVEQLAEGWVYAPAIQLLDATPA